MKSDLAVDLDLIVHTLFDKKGVNILTLDVRGVSTLTDYFVIVEGNVDTHVRALAKALLEAMKGQGYLPIHVEGMEGGEWVVIDFMDVVVHILLPAMRQKYSLEQLWHEGKVVETERVEG